MIENNLKYQSTTAEFTDLFIDSENNPSCDYDRNSISILHLIEASIVSYRLPRLLNIIGNDTRSININNKIIIGRSVLINSKIGKSYDLSFQGNRNSFGRRSSTESLKFDNSELIQYLDLDKISRSNEFLQRLQGYDNSLNEFAGMKMLYKEVLKGINLQNFSEIDDLISQFVLYKFSFQFHVAFLSITHGLEDRLQNHPQLVKRALAVGNQELESIDKVKTTLLGLI